MKSMKCVLIATGLLAGLAQGASDLDSVTLLQGQIMAEMLEIQSQKDLASYEAEPAREYNLPDDPTCSNEKAQKERPKQPSASFATLKESIASVRLTPEAESGDPAGAGVLRAFLELMIIALFCDGIRRWRLQKKDIGKTNPSPVQEAEAAEEAAWLAMVTAASTANDVNFQKALSSRPSVSRTDPWGCTPLHFAAAGGSASITAELLKKGVEVDALDASDETPLHFAARAGHATICDLLVDARANINAANVQDMTPLVVAGHANQEATCRLLADHGAGCGGLADEQLPPLVVSQLVRKVFAA